MRSRLLAIFGSIFFSTVVLVSLALNGRVIAEPAGVAAVPNTFRVSETSSGIVGDGDSTTPAISANGRYVAFASRAENLDPFVDDNFFQDIFVKDLQTQVITRVVSLFQTGSPNGDSRNPDISANGRFVAFETEATDFATLMEMVDDNNGTDIYIYDRENNFYDLVSADPNQFVIGDAPSYTPVVAANSAGGYRVAFVSEAANLHPGDTDRIPDIYVFTYDPGTFSYQMELVSVNSLGIKGNGGSFNPAISGDGRFIAFESDATNLALSDTNGVTDIFVHDMNTGVTRRVSVNANGSQATNSFF